MSEHDEQARAALRRIASDDPADIRARCATALLAHTPAEFAMFLTYTVRGGRLYQGAVTVRGDDTARRRLSAMEGMPALSESCWSPWRPRPVEHQRFVSVEHGPVPMKMLARSEGYRIAYEPFGICDHARVLLYDGRRFLGWLGLMRGTHRGFSRRELRRLDGLVPELSAALAAAEDLEADAVDDGLYMVVEPRTLKLEWASARARAWLDRTRADRLDGLLRAFRRGGGESTTWIDSHEVRVVELIGDHGRRYHVHVTRAGVPRLGLEAQLSPRQYAVAESAAAGATTEEIAAELGISRDTVAAHIRAIYMKLGVASRVELAARVLEDRRLCRGG